ncbi:ATP-grasp domain-containing protein [Myroides sp. LJL115]
MKELLRKVVFSVPVLRNYYLEKRIAGGELIPNDKISSFLDEADKVLLEGENIKEECVVGIVKDGYEPEGFTFSRYYYQKYVRFLKNNNIKYKFYNIFSSNWIEDAKELDVVVWHTNSDPITQDIALNKIYILEKIMGKRCLPSFDEIWSYENKVNAHYMYESLNLPTIPTFVSHDYFETMKYISTCKYPLISKSRTASASAGVEKISNYSQAKKLVQKAFSSRGLETNYFHDRQKDYVYFQEFISDATYDLRIIVIGNKALGYYRFPNKGDFRASGAGNYEKKEIPTEALDLAFKVKEAFGSTCLATDVLYSQKEEKYFIIESSIFIGVDTPKQLEINGVAGYYEKGNQGDYSFKQGKIWVQELALKELLVSQ